MTGLSTTERAASEGLGSIGTRATVIPTAEPTTKQAQASHIRRGRL
jgi:hypothetical protein